MSSSRSLAQIVVALLCAATAAHGQFTRCVSKFEQQEAFDCGSIDAALCEPFTGIGAQVIWRDPLLSGSTEGLIPGDQNVIPVTPINYAQVRPNTDDFTGLASPSYELTFAWADPTEATTAGVRLTTLNTTNLPDPSVHLQGKIRFTMAVTAFEFDAVDNFFGAQVTSNAAVYMCLAIRETGNAVAQGDEDSGGGDLEFVYLPTSELIPATTSGLIPFPPFGKRFAASSEPWPPDSSEFVQVEFDLGALTSSLIRGFANNGDGLDTAGDGVLDAMAVGDGVNRGVLESIVFSPDPTMSAGQYYAIYIDDVEFEAPVEDPTIVPPSVVPPLTVNDTTVTVNTLINLCDLSEADSVELFINGVSAAANQNPLTPAGGSATFTGVTLVAGDLVTARQSRGTVTSSESLPVLVFPQGVLLADGFDGYATQADLNTFWFDTVTPTPADAKLLLTPGSAATCPNFLKEDNPSLSNAARLYRSVGSVNGTDAEPLWVTWNFKFIDSTTLNGRTRFELARFDGGGFSTGPRGEGSAGITMFNQIAGPLISEYNLTLQVQDATLDDALTSNGWLDVGGFHRYPSGVARVIDTWHKMQIEVRSNVVNYYIDDINVNPAPYETGVPRPNSQPYTHVIIGEGVSTNNPVMIYDSVSVTLGVGGVNHPYGDPASPAPAIVGSLVVNDTSVTVTDVDPTATLLTVFSDGVEVADLAGPFVDTTVVIPTPPLSNNATITVVQTVGGEPSCPSVPTIVGAPPLAPTVQAPLEAGASFVTVTDVDGSASEVRVYANATTLIGTIGVAGEATVDVPVTPLVHLDLVTATAANVSGESPLSTAVEVGRGNGAVLIAIGVRETGGSGPVGANGGTTGGIEWVGVTTATPGAPQGVAISPSPDWQTLSFDPTSDPILGFAGSTADGTIQGTWGTLEHVAIAVDEASPDRSVGVYRVFIDNIRSGTDLVTDFESFAIGSEALFQEPFFSGSTDQDLLPPSVGPNVSQVSSDEGNPGQSAMLSWAFVDSTATRWVRLTSFQASNQPNPLVRLDEPISFDILLLETVPPDAPSVQSPVEDGDTVVTVNDILPGATLVRVFADGNEVGSADPLGATGGLAITLSQPLAHLQLVTASQSTPDDTSGFSPPLEVGRGNGDLLLALGVRETNDAGPIGSPGSTVGAIEWIGVDSTSNGAPQGIPVSTANGWQTIVFDPATAPIAPFAGGNGMLDVPRGTLEHLAIAVNAGSPRRSTGTYRIYIDNVTNLAGLLGTPITIASFEEYSLGDEVLFQEPTFSGSTDDNLLFPPSASANSDAYNNGGTRSQLVTWFFRDTDPGRWLRLTTFAADKVPSPIIDLTKPVTLDILVLEGCTTALGDMDGDCDIDADDVGPFIACLLGLGTASGIDDCICADFTGDGRVDLRDYAGFQDSRAALGGAPVPGLYAVIAGKCWVAPRSRRTSEQCWSPYERKSFPPAWPRPAWRVIPRAPRRAGKC